MTRTGLIRLGVLLAIIIAPWFLLLLPPSPLTVLPAGIEVALLLIAVLVSPIWYLERAVFGCIRIARARARYRYLQRRWEAGLGCIERFPDGTVNPVFLQRLNAHMLNNNRFWPPMSERPDEYPERHISELYVYDPERAQTQRDILARQ